MSYTAARKRLFAEAYVGKAAGRAYKAAEIAGYEGDYSTLCSTGSRLLRDDEVKEWLRVFQENNPLVMSREERLQTLTRFANGTEKVEVVSEDGMVAMVAMQPKDRLVAMKMLAEAAGEHVKVKVEVDDFSRKSTAEIDAMLAAMRGGVEPEPEVERKEPAKVKFRDIAVPKRLSDDEADAMLAAMRKDRA